MEVVTWQAERERPGELEAHHMDATSAIGKPKVVGNFSQQQAMGLWCGKKPSTEVAVTRNNLTKVKVICLWPLRPMALVKERDKAKIKIKGHLVRHTQQDGEQEFGRRLPVCLCMLMKINHHSDKWRPFLLQPFRRNTAPDPFFKAFGSLNTQFLATASFWKLASPLLGI